MKCFGLGIKLLKAAESSEETVAMGKSLPAVSLTDAIYKKPRTGLGKILLQYHLNSEHRCMDANPWG